MNLPSPSYSLDNSCAVIYNHTLYSYSPEAFQALKLQKNAKWEELPMGISVKGGVCVHRTPRENGALESMFIVGGVADTDSYRGLQRFTFSSGTWDTVIPSDPVIQNRMYHGAVYLNASDSILVYAGTQDQREGFSSQTFTVQASEPFRVSAFPSRAIPAMWPVILAWSDSEAVYFGGSQANNKLMLFDPKKSWFDSNITLANPTFNTENIKSVTISGDDATKILYTFDLSKSPNGVNLTVIRNSDGSAIQNARPTTSIGIKNVRQDEKLTAQNWPSYDESFAPRTSRKAYTISQDNTGLVVFSGGSKVESISIFDARGNHWEDATSFLGSKELSPPPSNTAASLTISENLKNSERTNKTTPPYSGKIIGAIVISILVAVIFIMVLLHCCRLRRAKAQYEKTNDPRLKSSSDEKDGMDFIDREIPDLILEKYSSPSRALKQSKKDSDLNNSYQIYKNAISKPISLHKRGGEDSPSYLEEARAAPQPSGNRRSIERRSSGWNRYWSSENSSPVLGFYVPKSNHNNPNHYYNQVRTNRDSLGPGIRTNVSSVSSGSPSLADQTQGYPYNR